MVPGKIRNPFQISRDCHGIIVTLALFLIFPAINIAAFSGVKMPGIQNGSPSVIAVLTNPKQIVVRPTPWGIRRSRRLSVQTFTAAFEAEYAPELGVPRKEAMLEMATN